MDLVRVAAILYAILMAGVVVFQIALAAGAPWGAYAMGGAAPGQFPPAMRIGAIIQAVLLAGMAVVILARPGSSCLDGGECLTGSCGSWWQSQH